jgi:putative endonuclease
MSKTKKAWAVYVLRCGDGSLYCGITTDLERRVREHSRGVASFYTRSRLPVVVAHSWSVEDRSAALRAEAAFKRLSRPEKLRWIAASPDAKEKKSSRARRSKQSCASVSNRRAV